MSRDGFRWIDFRVRPPYESFVPSFYRFQGPLPPAAPGEPRMPAIMRQVFRDPLPSRDEKSFDLFLKDMDEARVAIAVVTGRQDPATLPAGAAPEDGVANHDVAELVRSRPDRFVGIGGVDTSNPERALETIRGLADQGSSASPSTMVSVRRPGRTTIPRSTRSTRIVRRRGCWSP